MSIITCENYPDVQIVSIGNPTLEKTNFTIAKTISGTSTIKQTFTVKTGAFATVTDFSFFNFYSALNNFGFYIYLQKNGILQKPLVSRKEAIGVDITTGDTAIEIAEKIEIELNKNKIFNIHFAVSRVDDVLTFTANANGVALDPYDGAGFDLSTLGLTTLQAIIGYVLVDVRSGYQRRKVQQYVKFVTNIASSNIIFNY